MVAVVTPLAALSSSLPLGCGRFKSVNKNAISMGIPRASASPLQEGSPLLRAAHHTVDTYVRSGMVIGLGSGVASDMAIQYLGQQLRDGALEDVVGIPMSVTSASEAAKAGIPMEDFKENRQIDFAFDDADVVEEETLVAVIGRRKLREDESFIQEKLIINNANDVTFMIEEDRYRNGLEGSVPVLIQSLNWMATAEEIDDLFLGDAEVWRRSSVGQADPLGGDYPIITKAGHYVLDLIFTSPIPSLAIVAESLDVIDGVVGHGIILERPCEVVIATYGGLHTVRNSQTVTTKDL